MGVGEKQRAAGFGKRQVPKGFDFYPCLGPQTPEALTTDFTEGTDGNPISRQFYRRTRLSRRMSE